MKLSLLTPVVVVLFAMPSVVRSAQITNESFDGGANGWTGSTFGPGSWSFSGGEARITFFNTDPPFPYSGTLSNTPAASSGAFTGNYESAGINVIGFTFRAPVFLPSDIIELDWGGSTSVFRQGFSVAETGVWYNFSASISDQEKHKWGAIKGSLTDFATARRSVKYISVRVTTRVITNQTMYAIGSIYLANQPEVGGLSVDSANSTVGGSWLAPGATYGIEAAPEVTGTWSGVQLFMATNTTQMIPVTNGGDRLFWRLVSP